MGGKKRRGKKEDRLYHPKIIFSFLSDLVDHIHDMNTLTE